MLSELVCTVGHSWQWVSQTDRCDTWPMGHRSERFRPRRSRNGPAYSDQTFPLTICRSVLPCVGLSSALWKNGG